MDVRHLNKKHWPYSVKLAESTLAVVDEWCEQSIGEQYTDWFAYNHNTYAFKNEEHLLLFKLTWKTQK